MSKPNIDSQLGHFEHDGGSCRQVGDELLTQSAPVSSDGPSHTPDEQANADSTDSAPPLKPDARLPASDSSGSPSISQGLPSRGDPYLECANSLLPNEEAFPISFLQRRFRIGYSRAVRLHEAVIKRRTE